MREFLPQAQVAVGDVRDAAPAAADRLEYPPELLLRARGCLPRHAARVHVDDLRRAVAHQLDQPHQRGEDVERLESGDDHRHPVAIDEASKRPQPVMVAACPAARNPSIACSGHLGDDLHRRRDVLVRREHREVRRRIAEEDRGGGHRGGLEAGCKEHDLLVSRRAPGRPPARCCRRRRPCAPAALRVGQRLRPCPARAPCRRRWRCVRPAARAPRLRRLRARR